MEHGDKLFVDNTAYEHPRRRRPVGRGKLSSPRYEAAQTAKRLVTADNPFGLTARELQVLRLFVVEFLTDRAVVKRLGISMTSVNEITQRVYYKLWIDRVGVGRNYRSGAVCVYYTRGGPDWWTLDTSALVEPGRTT